MKGSAKLPKKIIEIADYRFANPNIKRSDVIKHFGVKWSKSESTIDKQVIKADKYNKERINKQEKIKDEVLVEATKDAAKRGILNRNEALEILSKIAKGSAREVPSKSKIIDNEKKTVEWVLQYPSDSERTNAIKTFAAIEGWNAPSQTEIKGCISGNIITKSTPEEVAKFYKEIWHECEGQ